MCQLQSSFFAHFMCFEVPALVPPGGTASGAKSEYTDDDDLGIMDIDDNDSKAGSLPYGLSVICLICLHCMF